MYRKPSSEKSVDELAYGIKEHAHKRGQSAVLLIDKRENAQAPSNETTNGETGTGNTQNAASRKNTRMSASTTRRRSPLWGLHLLGNPRPGPLGPNPLRLRTDPPANRSLAMAIRRSRPDTGTRILGKHTTRMWHFRHCGVRSELQNSTPEDKGSQKRRITTTMVPHLCSWCCSAKD